MYDLCCFHIILIYLGSITLYIIRLLFVDSKSLLHIYNVFEHKLSVAFSPVSFKLCYLPVFQIHPTSMLHFIGFFLLLTFHLMLLMLI